jgi:hypothetical protein
MEQQLHQLVSLPYHGHYGKLWTTSQKLCDVCYTGRQCKLVLLKEMKVTNIAQDRQALGRNTIPPEFFQPFPNRRTLQKALKLPRHSFLSRYFTISIKLLLLSSFLAFDAKYTILQFIWTIDRLCGLVVRVPGSISGATRLPEQ